MQVLITGVAGFIGFHLAERLLAMGYTVVGVDCLNDYYEVTLKYARLSQLGIRQQQIQQRKKIQSCTQPAFSFCQVNLSLPAEVDDFFGQYQFDYMVHFAAQPGVGYSLKNPKAYVDDNLSAFVNVLEVARAQRVKHFMFASSSSVYGLNDSSPYQASEATQHPISLYAATKKSNEMMAHAYSHLYQIPITGLRFFTVYGPWGRPDMAPMLFLNALLQKRPITVNNHGKMCRDFTFIGTIIEACVRVLRQPARACQSWRAQAPVANHSTAPFVLYNVGSGMPVRLLDFIETLENVVGEKANKSYREAPPGDVLSTHASMADFNRDFGVLPKVGLQDGLTQLVKWYRHYTAVKK